MISSQTVVNGTLKPDGTVELDEKPGISPGRVRVTLQPMPEPTQAGRGWWEVLEQIWKDQKARGFKGRGKEQVDADIQELRDELEQHANQVERLQEEAIRAREAKKAPPSTEKS